MIHIENLINTSKRLKSITKEAAENEQNRKVKYQKELKEIEQKRKNKFLANKDAKVYKTQRVLNLMLRKIVGLNNKISGNKVKIINPSKKTIKGKAVLFVPTHVFSQDVELVYTTMNCYARALIGGQVQILKSLDELFLRLSGVNFVNRKSKEDRKIASQNVEKQLAAGINQIAFIEGEWNLSINALIHHLSYSLIESTIKTNSEIQLVSLDREDKQFFLNYGERLDMGIYLEKYNLIKEEEEKKREFLSNVALEVRDKLATLKYETMVYKEAYIRGIDLNKEYIKKDRNRDYVYYTRRSELSENYPADQIAKIIEESPICDLMSFPEFIYEPKTDDFAFYDEFHSVEKVVDGEKIRTYID